ncbi:glycosyltransferase [Azospirillum sp. ST 5-10]|uniref:glycosyltransferase n=1 Tax=unclassified Azospirillum TaxID=2630922 RepID=UPI003F49CF58
MRIAYVTPNSPLPADRGGRLRAHHLWRALSAHAEVKAFVVGDTPPYRERELLRAGGGALFPRRRFRADPQRAAVAGLWEAGPLLNGRAEDAEPWPELWRSLARADAFDRHQLNERRAARLAAAVRAFGPDLVVLCDTSLAGLLPWMKALGYRAVLGPHNLDSALYRAIAATAADPAERRWATLVADRFAFLERTYLPLADQLWACSEIDAARFRDALGLAQARTVPNAVDVTAPLAPNGDGNLVYVGQMGYRPNEQAALALIALSRRLAARGVAHTLHLVGRSTDRIRAAAAGLPGVRVVGPVPDVGPYLAMASVVPVALAVGGGTRIKILEAMAAGRPVVSTAVGIEGIAATPGVDCVVADDPGAFEAAVEGLLRDPARAEAIGLAGFRLVREAYSQEAVVRLVGERLRELGLAPARPAPRAGGGAAVVARSATFNPFSRLLSVRLQVRAAVPLDGAVVMAGDPPAELANAAATVGWTPGRGRPTQLVEAVAVLPPDVAPADVRVRMQAYGAPVLDERGDAWEPVEERAGLIALTRDAGQRRLGGLGWFAAADGQPTAGLDGGGGAAALAGTVPTARPALRLAGFYQPYEPAADGGRRLHLRPGAAAAAGQSFGPLAPLWEPRPPSSRRLAGLRDVHAGRTAWLIGNGPSVRPEDLDRLRGEITFGFNRFHLAHGMTALRPTYTVTGDRQMIEDFGQEIVDRSGGTVFVADAEPPELVGDFVWLRQIAHHPPLFSFDPAEFVSPGGSSLFVAMQLAYFMGIRTFHVYGADFRFVYERSGSGDKFRTATGDNNHFIPNYRSNRPWCPPSFRDICPAFLAARVLMESGGGWIRNATRGGLLEIFERADFDAVAPGGRAGGAAPTPARPARRQPANVEA